MNHPILIGAILRNLELPFILWIQIDIHFLASTSSHPFTGILTEEERDAIYARHGIDIPRMRREYEERTGRPWPTTTEMMLEQFGTAEQRPGEGPERDPEAD